MQVNIDNLTTEFVCENKNDVNRFESAVLGDITVEVPGAKYTWEFKRKTWDGKVCLCQKEGDTYSIQTGLVPRVLRKLSKVSLTLNDFRGLGTPKISASQIALRPYQLEGVAAALGHTEPHVGWWPRGVIKVATGGGKTEMAVAMYEMNPVPTMFLVHRKDLLVQAAERFAKYGHTVGMIGDSKFDISPTVTIATMQTLHKIISDPDDPRYDETLALVTSTEQLFFDECHLMASTVEKGNMFVDIANQFVNAGVRWGLTATPFMRGNYDNMLLESVTGEMLYEITNAELIALGYLTPPKIRIIDVPGKTVVHRSKKKGGGAGQYWRLVSDACIVGHKVRNKAIAEEIMRGPDPQLCLVQTITQADNIQEELKKLGSPPVKFLSGKDNTKVRRQAVADLQSGKVRAILCTTIFDEGVDIPELRKIILASGGKSHVKLLQRLGRGLRLAAGKLVVEIVDFADRHHEMVRKHALERLKRYKEEGFEIVNG